MWFVLAISAAIIWGFSELFFKKSTQTENNILLFFWQYVLQGILYILVYFVLGEGLLKNFRLELLFIILPIAFAFWASMFIYIKAISNSKLSIVSPIMSSSYILAVILGIAFLNEKVTYLQTISIILILISMVLLIRCKNIDKDSEVSNKKYVYGIILGLIYFIVVGISSFAEKAYLNFYVEPTEYIFYYGILCLIMTTIMFFTIKNVKKDFMFRLPNIDTWKGIIYCNMAGVIYIYTLSMNNISLVEPIVSSYVVVTEILAAFILKERVSLKQRIYIILIILGVIMISL
ncbi:MAG TPA: hypothetical protein DEP72_08795 [Clostridiales bacterium]|nr:MAG: hypothetical protein A2Y18_03735 [Clostridiales bacterium GWD2_32_19]HCC08236.1 hypothetical protein [Clostridiales bacterium]